MKLRQLFADLSALPTIVWDNVATTFTALKISVTDTASSAASLLADFQVGGTSFMKLLKAGAWQASQVSTVSNPTYGFRGASGAGVFFTADSMVGFSATSAERGRITGGGYVTHLSYNFSSGAGTTVDVSLFRDAANILAQRNVANAQTYRVYNTFTSSTNYERLSIGWSGNVCTIQAEAQTGTVRPLQVKFTPQTVASLPAAGTAGAGTRTFVSDALAPTFGSAVAGGGAVNVPVYSDGANWMVG